MTRKRILQAVILAGVVCVVMSAWWYLSTVTGPGAEELSGKKWVLQSFVNDGQRTTFPSDVEITIEFGEEGKATGSGGCNRYATSYELGSGSKMSFGQIASTEMYCSETMELEDQYFKALGKVMLFQISDSNLQLSSGDGRTVLNFTTHA